MISDLKIKVVSSSTNNENIKNKNSNNYKIKPETKSQNWNIKVGDNVKHKEENIFGKVINMDNTKIIVVWNDNTKERIKLVDAINDLEYVDDIQTILDPMVPQISKTENTINEDVNLAINKALASLDEDIIDDDIVENIIEQPKEADIEKIKLQRKVNELQNKLDNKTNNNMKDKIASDLIDLAITKNMIEFDDAELEKQMILSMDDNEFEEYKNKVLSYQVDGEVTSAEETIEDKELSEAEKALNKIKGNGGKGIIGDFNNMTYIPSSDNTLGDEKRSLSEVRDSKITFSNQQIIPTFEDQFVDILSSRVDQPSVNHQPQQTKVAQTKKLPGFENLQGLTKPLVVTKPAMQNPTNSSFHELFSSMEWTTLGSKR